MPSLEQEAQLGAREARRFRQQHAMMRDRVITSYMSGLGAKLAAACTRPSPFSLRFYIFEDESLDAFALPGGGIYVSTGLILRDRCSRESLQHSCGSPSVEQGGRAAAGG
jgi:predicted Zn-dependent protease